MTRSLVAALLVFLVAGLLGSCGGSSGGGAAHPLEGTWVGASVGNPNFRISVDAGGKIVQFEANGQETGRTGVFTALGGGAYAIDVFESGVGSVPWRLLLHGSNGYAAFFRLDAQDGAALERGAAAVTIRTLADYAPRAFKGPAARFDATGALAELGESKVQFTAAPTFQGNFGSLSFQSLTGQLFGLRLPSGTSAEGRYEDNDGTHDADKLIAVISPDGQFLAGIALDRSAPVPNEAARFISAWVYEP